MSFMNNSNIDHQRSFQLRADTGGAVPHGIAAMAPSSAGASAAPHVQQMHHQQIMQQKSQSTAMHSTEQHQQLLKQQQQQQNHAGAAAWTSHAATTVPSLHGGGGVVVTPQHMPPPPQQQQLVHPQGSLPMWLHQQQQRQYHEHHHGQQQIPQHAVVWQAQPQNPAPFAFAESPALSASTHSMGPQPIHPFASHAQQRGNAFVMKPQSASVVGQRGPVTAIASEQPKLCCIQGCKREAGIRNLGSMKRVWQLKPEHDSLTEQQRKKLKICTCHYNEDLKKRDRELRQKALAEQRAAAAASGAALPLSQAPGPPGSQQQRLQPSYQIQLPSPMPLPMQQPQQFSGRPASAVAPFPTVPIPQAASAPQPVTQPPPPQSATTTRSVSPADSQESTPSSAESSASAARSRAASPVPVTQSVDLSSVPGSKPVWPTQIFSYVLPHQQQQPTSPPPLPPSALPPSHPLPPPQPVLPFLEEQPITEESMRQQGQDVTTEPPAKRARRATTAAASQQSQSQAPASNATATATVRRQQQQQSQSQQYQAKQLRSGVPAGATADSHHQHHSHHRQPAAYSAADFDYDDASLTSSSDDQSEVDSDEAGDDSSAASKKRKRTVSGQQQQQQSQAQQQPQPEPKEFHELSPEQQRFIAAKKGFSVEDFMLICKHKKKLRRQLAQHSSATEASQIGKDARRVRLEQAGFQMQGAFASLAGEADGEPTLMIAPEYIAPEPVRQQQTPPMSTLLLSPQQQLHQANQQQTVVQDKRFVSNVTLSFSLSNEPVHAYRLLATDLHNGLLAAQLRDFVLYVETHDRRYELSLQQQQRQQQLGNTPTQLFRWCEALRPHELDRRRMQELPCPLPTDNYHSRLIFSDLTWPEIEWGKDSVRMRGLVFGPLLRAFSYPKTPAPPVARPTSPGQEDSLLRADDKLEVQCCIDYKDSSCKWHKSNDLKKQKRVK